MHPLIPLGLGALALVALQKKAKAAASEPPSPYAQQAPVPSGPPVAEPKPAAKATSDMPELLKRQMADALGALGIHPLTGEASGAADADAIRTATQIVGQLESQGYYDAARDLRGYVDKAQAKVPTPSEGRPIAAAAPPQLTAEQREYIARILTLERSPSVLANLIEWLRRLPPSQERDGTISMVQALRLQVLESQSTNETLQKMDEVIRAKSPSQLEGATVLSQLPRPQTAVAPVPPAPVPAPSPTALPLPEAPAAVPAQPVPQPLPKQLSPLQQSAATLAQHLLALERQYGGPAGARGKQNTNIVRSFQQLAGAKVDGKPGPSTLLRAAAAGAYQLPLVMYWPSGSSAATVATYRKKLAELAAALDARAQPADANIVRMSAAREKGQGMSGAVSASALPRTTSGVNAAQLAQMPTMRVGSRGSNVVMLQKALILAGHSPGAADGIYGSGTKRAVTSFQRKLGLSADGIAGPNTLKTLAQTIALVAAA